MGDKLIDVSGENLAPCTVYFPACHLLSLLFFRALQNSHSTPLDRFPTILASPHGFLCRTSGEHHPLPRSETPSS